MDIKLPEQVNIVLEVLECKGFEAYVTGGCVRDSLLNKIPKDWDICTDALPHEIKECFCSYKTIDTGLKYGTVTVVVTKMEIQITTYRIDTDYLDFRRPDKVEFTRSLREDCKRRDFTVNAMAYNPKQGLKDFFNGFTDLTCKVIRCVGNAQDRFGEDALRILRALRFSSVLGFSIEAGTSKTIHELYGLLENISSERVFSELSKLLSGKNIYNVLIEYPDVISVFIPYVKHCEKFKIPHTGMSLWEHISRSISIAADISYVKWALLFHKMGLDANDLPGNDREIQRSKEIALEMLVRLKADGTTLKKTILIIENKDIDLVPDKHAILRQLKRIGPEMYIMLLEFLSAHINAGGFNTFDQFDKVKDCKNIFDYIINKNLCWSVSRLNINGLDLINAGMDEGIRLGQILDRLTDEVIEELLPNRKEPLLQRALELWNEYNKIYQ